MAYCRFADDDHQCDVYVYEGDGFVTMVAANRRVFTAPLPPPIPCGPNAEAIEAWIKRQVEVGKLVETSSRLEPIGLPHAGEMFVDADESACADRLESLKQFGYRVPQDAIDCLRAEAADTETG